MSSLQPDLPGRLERIYARRFDAQRDYRNRVWEVLVNRFFQKLLPADGAVLDLGCGYGQFINHVRARKRYGMDLNPRSRDVLDPAITFFEQDCSKHWPLPDNSLDVVFTSNFFEHLPDKATMERTLREAARCLKTGGRLIAMGPNIRCVPGAYWDFWDHHIPLTELSLSEVLETSGFAVERAIPRFLPYTMVNQREAPLALVRLYLRIPLAWRLRGQQFLVIGRKL